MARNNPSLHCGADEERPNAPDQAQDLTVGDHGSQEEDDQPDQGQPPYLEVPGLYDQEWQQPNVPPQMDDLLARNFVPPKGPPADLNQMQANAPPQIIKRLKCKCLFKGLGFSLEAAQVVIYNHGYNTAKKLPRLNPMMLTFLSRPYAP